MDKIYLIEDHHEALKIWRKKRVRGLGLVHLDAHIDFAFHQAMPLEKIIADAKSVGEIKKKIEYSLAFLNYEKSLDKQTHIGNYIYPAIQEGIVKNFYWVVPGRGKGFAASSKAIRSIAGSILKEEGRGNKIFTEKSGVIRFSCLGSNFFICNLDNLPFLNSDTLLDIDADFLVINSVKDADNTTDIARRKPWILPRELAETLKEKIKRPEIITIAYSVDGGWTPIRYRYFADELAYCFSPRQFQKQFKRAHSAAINFNFFNSTGKKVFYQKAAVLDPSFRRADNNYGPLYLLANKPVLAGNEFRRILRADGKNPACLLGLGEVYLRRKKYTEAKKYFNRALKFVAADLFKHLEKFVILNLAKAEFHLNSFNKAKQLFIEYNYIDSLCADSYYYLGIIYKKENDFVKSAKCFKDALCLGFNGIEPLEELVRICFHLEDKKDIIKYIRAKYNLFKKGLLKAKGGAKINTSCLLRAQKRLGRIEKVFRA